MKISAKVRASTRLYMKKFHKSQRDPSRSRRLNPSLEKSYLARRIDLGWLLRSCKYLLQVYRRRVDPLRMVEAKGDPSVVQLATRLSKLPRGNDKLMWDRNRCQTVDPGKVNPRVARSGSRLSRVMKVYSISKTRWNISCSNMHAGKVNQLQT